MGNAGVNIVLPLFGVMLAGYLAGRFRVLMEGSSAILSRFVFAISLPALIFISLSRFPVKDFFDWPFLGALGGGMLSMFCVSLLIARVAFPGNFERGVYPQRPVLGRPPHIRLHRQGRNERDRVAGVRQARVAPPPVTWWLAHHMFALEGNLPAIAVVQAALPSGVPVFVLAQQYNTFVTRSSAVIVVSTAVSAVTLSVLLFFFER